MENFAKEQAARYAPGVTVLPIADRELRVSARSKATHRLRILFAVGAVAIGGAISLLTRIGGGSSSGQAGIWIFGALKWIAFIFACAAGTFLTSDCLSEEKREGTLGLLFLTDLRGHDVVLGKLSATSLRTFCSLLAIFPVMALSFILGGVAANDFWHTLVAICNTLFFSLALGMVVSVVSRDPHKAMTGALATMSVFLLLIFADSPAGLLSPIFAFRHASSYRASDFWHSIILVHLAGWCFLAAASWLAPKTWQEKSVRPGLGTGWKFPLFGSAKARVSSRRLRDKSPVCWIISRDRWTSNLARLAILLVLGVFALSLASFSQSPASATRFTATAATPVPSTTTTTTRTITTNGSTTYTIKSNSTIIWGGGMARNVLYMIASQCAYVLSLALEFWLAANVCRFYLDGKKSGFLELLLVTPMQPADVIAGHWLALRRLFLAPMAAQLFLTLACGAIQVWATSGTAVAAARGVTGSNDNFELQQFLALGLGAISWCLGLFTIVWYSIWMGMTSNKITIAMLKTFWYSKILPWFSVSIGSGFLFMVPMMVFKFGAVWLWTLMTPALFIVVNLALITLARRRAYSAFTKWRDSPAA